MIGASLEPVIDNSLEVAIGALLDAAIDAEISPLDKLPILPSDKLPILPSDEMPILPLDKLLILPLDKLPILPSDELPILPLDKLPILHSDKLPILLLDKLPILPLDELPIKNNNLKNRNSRIKYQERRKKKRCLAADCLVLQMVSNPMSDPDNNPLTAAPLLSTTTSCPPAGNETFPSMLTKLTGAPPLKPTDLSRVRKRQALEGAMADCKSPPELEHPFKTIPANPELANMLVQD